MENFENLNKYSNKLNGLNERLREMVKDSSTCANCTLHHDGICFFAYWCFQNDFKDKLEDYYLEMEYDYDYSTLE